MSKVEEFTKFLDKDLGITLNKTGMDRNLGESDITTGDTEDERKKDVKKKKVTQLVEGLSKKGVAGDVGAAAGESIGRAAGEVIGAKFSKQPKPNLEEEEDTEK